MITSIGFRWFRSFRDQAELELAPITLLYGQNSAGKSSVLKSLLFLKQNVGDTSENGEFSYTSRLVDLGSSRAMAYLHRSHEPTSFNFVCMVKLPVELGGRENGDSRVEVGFHLPHDEIDSQVSYRFKDLPDEPTIMWDMSTVGESRRVWILKNDSLDAFRRLFGGVSSSVDGEDPTGGIDLWTRPVMSCIGMLPGIQIGTYSGSYREFPRFRSDGSTYRAALVPTSGWSWDAFAANGLRAAVADSLRRTIHIGPARRLLNRIEPSAMVADPSDPGLLVALRQDDVLRTRLNQRLASLGIDYEVVSRRVEDSVLGEIHSLELRNVKSGAVTALTDVGYGISQVLPIVMEAHRPGQSLLLIEQPELHLHPKLQAELADLFISTALGGARTNFLIETHSEAIILRLLKRIREGRLSHEAVRVIYVDQDSEGVSTAINLRIDEDGEFIDRWPSGFFDERIKELLDDHDLVRDNADSPGEYVPEEDE